MALIGPRTAKTRDLGTPVTIGSISIPLAAIVGIAVGGTVVLLLILIPIAIFTARRLHHKEQKRIRDADGHGHVDVDLNTAIRSAYPPEISLIRRFSGNSFLPLDDGLEGQDWTDQLYEDGFRYPPIARQRRMSAQRAFFRMSGMRKSWPLATNIPMALLPGHSTIAASQVAPPGYVVQESKPPKRHGSKLSKRTSHEPKNLSPSKSLNSVKSIQSLKSSKSVKSQKSPIFPITSHSPTNDIYIMANKRPRIHLHRRSTSENQLSTILRSTSQRLKATQRETITRSRSTIGRCPGVPLSNKLLFAPREKATESQEALIGRDLEQPEEVVYNSYPAKTPSPKKYGRSKSLHVPKRQPSPASSEISSDSLCVINTPEVVIPVPLTSPSKKSLIEDQHRVSILSAGDKNMFPANRKEGRASIQVVEFSNNLEPGKLFASPQRISLASDPFYSSVKSAKPLIPLGQLQEPRPMYIRKATFGGEATSDRPASFCSPLRDVSGNSQTPAKKAQPPPAASPVPNPFQWSPQEASATRATSPKRNSQGRRKGHKRSNVVEISTISRPPSTVEVVLEESEEDSPLRFSVPAKTSRHLNTLRKISISPSPSAISGRRGSTKPPSAATFNPTLVVPHLTTGSASTSAALGVEDARASAPYSPTLSVCNYYTNGYSSEDEFFSQAKTKSPKRHGRNFSADLVLFPLQSKEDSIETLTIFPAPNLLNISSRPSPRPLPSIASSLTGLPSSVATTVPPLLTIPTPAHLNGPRSPPPRSGTISPRYSLGTSISILRRMSSPISSNTIFTTPDDSPTLPSLLSVNFTEESESRGRSRRPKGKEPVRPKAKAASRQVRDSHRVTKERRKRRQDEMEGENELTPVKEVSSPLQVSAGNPGNALGLRFPVLSREGSLVVTPARGTPSKTLPRNATQTPGSGVLSSEGADRWSSAMDKSLTSAVRRESKMEHPSPQTPPSWGREVERLMSETKARSEDTGKRGSLGLYDVDGFLRSSPEHLTEFEEEMREAKKDAKRLSGFMM